MRIPSVSSAQTRGSSRAGGERSALFDAEEEEESATGAKTGEELGRGQWEVGSDTEMDDDDDDRDTTRKQTAEAGGPMAVGVSPWADEPRKPPFGQSAGFPSGPTPTVSGG